MLEVIRLRIRIQEFLKDSSTLRDMACFHNLAYISGESDRTVLCYPGTKGICQAYSPTPSAETA